MPLLFKDYTNLVLKAYEEKRNANLLSQLLIHPTAASIKQECINVYRERLDRGERIEENTLRAFFGILPEGKNYGNLIEWQSLGKFKSIQKLLKKEVENPSSANVELLAWLIDFNPRPLSQAQIMFRNTNETNIPISPLSDNDEGKLEQSQSETDSAEIKKILLDEKIEDTKNLSQNEIGKTSIKDEEYVTLGAKTPTQNRILKMATATSLVLVTVLGGGYMLGKNDTNNNTGCMYWAVDHYEPVSCNEKGKGLLVPFDQEKIKSFRKIMRKDTITEWSIGKLYYIKNNNDIECYTEGGNYPLDITRTLKVLSQHMFDTYLRNIARIVDSSAESQTKSLPNR